MKKYDRSFRENEFEVYNPKYFSPRIFRVVATAVAVLLLPLTMQQGFAKEIYVSALEGAESGDGSQDRPFARIQSAVDQAGPGDTVIVADGIYRERVQPRQGGEEGKPLVIQAAKGARPVIRGTDPFTPEWETGLHHGRSYYHAPLDPALFVAYELPWEDAFVGPRNPFHTKVMISNLRAKQDSDLQARPWPPVIRAASEDQAEKTFDTDNRRAVYDGPPGTLPKTLGQVFSDGKPLRQVADMDELMLATHAFLVSADGERLLVNMPPDLKPEDFDLEITTRAQCFVPAHRGVHYIHLRGITFEKAANQGPFPQAGMVSTRSGGHWIIEDCVIRYATTVGLDCGGETYTNGENSGVSGGSHRTSNIIIRGCEISDNGLSGIAAFGTRNLLIQGNLLERNNRLDYIPGINAGWWELAAIKLHHAPGVVIEKNLVRDNEAFGIWIDTGYANSRISRNTLLNNKLAGIFGEASFGPMLIDNNIVAYTRSGHGIYMHDGSDVKMVHNLVFRNAAAGIFLRNVRPLTVKYETSNNVIYGNLILGNYYAGIALPFPNEKNRNNYSDWNVLSGGSHFYDNGPVEMIFHSRTREFYQAESFTSNLPEGTLLVPLQWKDEDILHMDLGDWQKITKQDQHSINPFPVKSPYMGLRARELSFELTVPSDLAAYRLPEALPEAVKEVMAQVETDFLGNRSGGHRAVPGPFSVLKEGRVTIPINPLEMVQ